MGRPNPSFVNPDCLGKKCCPKGPNNANRAVCPRFFSCLNLLILRRLDDGKSPSSVRRELLEIWEGISDYMALKRIARVAIANGFDYGRKKIDRVIRESDLASKFEKSDVRVAFGVYGRKGAGVRKSTRIGPTLEANEAANAQTACIEYLSVSHAFQIVIGAVHADLLAGGMR